MTTFAVSGPETEDELGVWQSLPPAASPLPPGPGPLESLPAEEAGPDAFVWQVALSADMEQNRRDLSVARLRVESAGAAIPWAANCIDAFAHGQRVGAGTPEAELAAWVALLQPAPALEAWEGPRPAGEALLDLPDFRNLAAQTSAFFERVRMALRHLAVVQTSFDGRHAAQTVITWTGDYRTIWQSGVTCPQARQHLQVVAVSMRTRDAWLGLAATAVTASVQLAALFAANPLLALPATYRFVRRIITQIQERQTLPVLTT